MERKASFVQICQSREQAENVNPAYAISSHGNRGRKGERPVSTPTTGDGSRT